LRFDLIHCLIGLKQVFLQENTHRVLNALAIGIQKDSRLVWRDLAPLDGLLLSAGVPAYELRKQIGVWVVIMFACFLSTARKASTGVTSSGFP